MRPLISSPLPFSAGFSAPRLLSTAPQPSRPLAPAAPAAGVPPYTPLTATEPFPSIVIGADGMASHGSFASAQEAFINPDPSRVSSLAAALQASNSCVVAHYYMDVELQAVLAALPDQSRVFVADSLAMGDAAVRMVEAGADSVICLGVDFMSESVKAIMSKNGHASVPVYRATASPIGCSLAESAEALSYGAWLTQGAAKAKNPLHVIYINTSLETKALSTQLMPTVTCTSSNVLRTMLQSDLQVEDLSVYYGPDTFMGENLRTLFQKVLANWSDAEIKERLHPEHSRASIQRLHDNLNVFPSGNCVVHHMFGAECTKTVTENYPDAFVSAHLEVPGEMFEIAMEKSISGKGVVGSTADILNFIKDKVAEAAEAVEKGGKPPAGKKNLQFVLGTEAGMVTSIVNNVQAILSSMPLARDHVTAEIVFPVASDAVTQDPDSEFGGIVPGVSGGEGCSTAGGCATCPFMKMNDLDAVLDIAETIRDGDVSSLAGHHPPNRIAGKMLGDREAVDVGVDSIMHMRHLMSEGRFSDELVQEVKQRSAI